MIREYAPIKIERYVLEVVVIDDAPEGEPVMALSQGFRWVPVGAEPPAGISWIDPHVRFSSTMDSGPGIFRGIIGSTS